MKRVYTSEKLNKFVRLNSKLQINLDEKPSTSEDSNGFSYLRTTINLGKGSLERSQVIESIIRSKYGSYGAELAAQFNGGDELQEHQDWRQLAKDTADELIQNYFTIMNNTY